jgi:hypothetical protein
MKKIVLALTVLPFFTGCSTIVNGTSQNVSPTAYEQNADGIYTNVNTNADCTLTNKERTASVKSGSVVVVKRSNSDLHVKCQEGKKIGEKYVEGKYRAESIGGNILAGGPIGIAVDGFSGASFEYPEFIKVFISDKGNPTQEKDTYPSFMQSK